MKYMTELEILRKTSERQSEMLALALKEKNELLNKVTNVDRIMYTSAIDQLQSELSATRSELMEIKRAAANLFVKLGLS
jgi:hypothetical protein